jgi:hypothetical protein
VDTEKLEEINNKIKDEVNKDFVKINKLDKAIDEIKSAFLREVENTYLKFIPELLEKINDGLPTPALSVCGRGTQEIRFTKYLGYMLDGSKNHGLKEELLKQSLNEIANFNGLKEDWFNQCKVETELWLGNYSENGVVVNCFCDIGIIGEDFAILIEQKILSGESLNQNMETGQLSRYSHCMNNNPKFSKKKIIKIYLTPTGKLPEDVNDWIPLTHSQLVEKGLDLIAKGNFSQVARENLKRLLIDLAMGPYQKEEGNINELVQIAMEIKESFVYCKLIRFCQLLNENRLIVKVIMEGNFSG